MNKKLQLAVCDDDTEVLDIIASSIVSAFRKNGQEVSLEMFKGPGTLAKRMKETHFDLLFLDIDMPKMDGIEFASMVQKQKIDTEIIFVSNREDRVFDTFRLHPFGFVRKSNFLKDISAVVDSYLHTHSQREDDLKMSVQTQGGILTLPLGDIQYIEGNGKTQLLYLKDKEEPVQLRTTMEKLEEELTPKGFMRIHKGYLVNYRYIRVIDHGEIILTNDVRLPISRAKVQEVRQSYLALLQGNDASIF